MKEKPYIIRGDNYCDQPSIVKIKYGKKFVIAKLKHQSAGLKIIENALNAFIRGGKNNKEGIYYHLFNYVKEHPDNKFKVISLAESDNGYILLIREQHELDNNKRNPDFLNNQTQAYIPEYNSDTEMFGWLKKNEVLNFKKWLKHRRKNVV